MKNIKKIALALLVLASLTWACEKIEVGYLSDYIKYQNPILFLTPGTDVKTGPLMEDGSTKPLHVEILEIRNAETGEIATDLLTPRPVINWIETYEYGVDTTEAQIMAKLEFIDKPAFEINNISGQMVWNTNTRYAEGKKYEFDLKISNIKGEKVYPAIGQVELLPNEPVSFYNSTQMRIIGPTGYLDRWAVEVEDMKNGTSEACVITKISDETAPGITVRIKVVDKNDTAFNPAAGEVEGSWAGSDYPYGGGSVNTIITDEYTSYYFPVTPFPFPATYLWMGNPPYQMYHVNSQAVGNIDHADYVPGDAYNLRIYTRFWINMPGTWEIKFKYDTVTRS